MPLSHKVARQKQAFLTKQWNQGRHAVKCTYCCCLIRVVELQGGQLPSHELRTPRCGVPKLHVWLRLQHVQMQLILKHDDHPTHLGAVGQPTTRQRGTLHDAGTPVREGIMRANCGAVGPSSRLQGSTKHNSFP